MKRLLGLLALLALATLPAMAQSDSFPRIEAGGGFMYRSFNLQFAPRQNEVGWFATADYNFANWLGFDLDVDEGFAGSDAATAEYHHFTFMAGPQVYPIGHHRITPFVHALFGDSTLIFPTLTAFDSGQTLSDDKFGFALGGGVDWSLTHRIAIRVAQFDYEQTRNFGGGSAGNPLQNNFKLKTGVIFRF
jgi:opacity protein-like surface antigen